MFPVHVPISCGASSGWLFGVLEHATVLVAVPHREFGNVLFVPGSTPKTLKIETPFTCTSISGRFALVGVPQFVLYALQVEFGKTSQSKDFNVTATGNVITIELLLNV